MSLLRPPLCMLLFISTVLPGREAAAEEMKPLLTHVAADKDRDYGRGRKLVVIYYGNDIEAPTSDNPVYQNMYAFCEKIEQACKDDALSAEAKVRLADNRNACVSHKPRLARAVGCAGVSPPIIQAWFCITTWTVCAVQKVPFFPFPSRRFAASEGQAISRRPAAVFPDLFDG